MKTRYLDQEDNANPPDTEFEMDVPQDRHFSSETVEGLAELGEVLLGIHKRLIEEGYIISENHISHGTGISKSAIEEN